MRMEKGEGRQEAREGECRLEKEEEGTKEKE